MIQTTTHPTVNRMRTEKGRGEESGGVVLFEDAVHPVRGGPRRRQPTVVFFGVGGIIADRREAYILLRERSRTGPAKRVK